MNPLYSSRRLCAWPGRMHVDSWNGLTHTAQIENTTLLSAECHEDCVPASFATQTGVGIFDSVQWHGLFVHGFSTWRTHLPLWSADSVSSLAFKLRCHRLLEVTFQIQDSWGKSNVPLSLEFISQFYLLQLNMFCACAFVYFFMVWNLTCRVYF